MSSKKKSQANKNRSSKNSEIIFVRRYPFYCSVQNQSKSKSTSKTNVTTESYYFQVTVSALAPFHESTGMTVDLVQLDRVAKKIFKPDGSAQFTLKSLLKNKRALLEKALKLKKTRLIALQFDECRGLSLKFKEQQSFSIHHNYAADEKGDLFKVSSQFNEIDELVELEIRNLKLDLHERIIF